MSHAHTQFDVYSEYIWRDIYVVYTSEPLNVRPFDVFALERESKRANEWDEKQASTKRCKKANDQTEGEHT